jgi:small subunit ribosomal protein S4
MSRYRGPSCKLCRRSREKLFLKGERCFTMKCEIEKRNYPPGIRSLKPAKLSEYGRRLREKQKLRFFYGVTEKQMRMYFKQASNEKGVTGNNLLSRFEKRFDNVMYRSILAKSRKQGRQLVKHSHFLLNGKKVDIPSIILKAGDEISIRKDSEDLFKPSFELLKDKSIPEWLVFDEKQKTIKVLRDPSREEIDVPVEEQLIVEYYSK